MKKIMKDVKQFMSLFLNKYLFKCSKKEINY